MEQKHQITQQAEPSLFLPLTRCLLSRNTLVVPACFPHSIHAWHGTRSFLVLAGSCRLRCGLLVWELPAPMSPRRMLFGRGKGVQDTQFQFSFQINATCESETQHSKVHSSLCLVMDVVTPGNRTCVYLAP